MFRVGWRAGVIRDGASILIGFGWDFFYCSSEGRAKSMAVKLVPGRISAPGCSIGIRYVQEVE